MATGIEMRDVVIRGMHGMGDNVHQRAIVRKLINVFDITWLETPWPCIYHDLFGPKLKLFLKSSKLRTQARNAAREVAFFINPTPSIHAKEVRVWYRPEQVRRLGSIVAAMGESCSLGGELDFRLPIPEVWRARARRWIESWRPPKPLLIYRPLVERTEWKGCTARNPDPVAYFQLVRSIRDDFFVVSIADLVPGVEWESGVHLYADVELHAGELEFEDLAALTSMAAMTICSPGFLIPLSQSVGTPCVAIHGGHESSRAHSYGKRFAPYLGIDPIKPCDCYKSDHACDKRIDINLSTLKLREFIDASVTDRLSIFRPGQADQLGRAASQVYEPRRARGPSGLDQVGVSETSG